MSFPLLILPPSIEWAQNTAAATTTWGDIGDWDVSGVADFSYAFSTNRDATGGTSVTNGNLKAATFVGTAMSKWIMTSATTLELTFYGASEMNSNLSGWNVAKVTSLHQTFREASKFTGTGLATWDTASVTHLNYVFFKAGKFNGDISGWDTGKVTDIDSFATNSGLNQDLSKWNIQKCNRFNGLASLGAMDACNKRKLALSW